MAAKTCKACGSQVPDAALFCTQCGSREVVEAAIDTPPTMPVASSNPWETPPPPSPTPLTTSPPPGAPPMGGAAPPPPAPAANPWESPAPVAPPMGGVAPPPPAPTVPVAERTVVTEPVQPQASEPTQVWNQAPANPPFQGGQATSTASPWQTPSAPSPDPSPWQTSSPAPPIPAPTPNPSSASTTGGGRVGALIGLLGGAAAVVGAFLTWVTITPGGAQAADFAGWTLTDDAKIVVGIGAVAIVVSVIALSGSARAVARIVLALCGLGLLGIGIYEIFDLMNKFPDRLEAAGFSDLTIKAPQLGLILVLVGGGVALIGSLAMRAKKIEQVESPQAAATMQTSTMPSTPPTPFQ